MLDVIVPDLLWHRPYPVSVAGFGLHARMTVARLAHGGLWLHSPAPFDPALAAEVAVLGPVEHLCAPNRFHHLHAAHWRAHFRDAVLHGAPSLPFKRRDLHFDALLGGPVPPPWRGTLQQEVFHGLPLLDEVVFLHVPTRTLVVTDLCAHLPGRKGLAGWLLDLAGVGRGVAMSRTLRWQVKDRALARSSRDRILAWDFDRLVMAHETIVETGGKQAFAEAMAWLDA